MRTQLQLRLLFYIMQWLAKVQKINLEPIFQLRNELFYYVMVFLSKIHKTAAMNVSRLAKNLCASPLNKDLYFRKMERYSTGTDTVRNHRKR